MHTFTLRNMKAPKHKTPLGLKAIRALLWGFAIYGLICFALDVLDFMTR